MTLLNENNKHHLYMILCNVISISISINISIKMITFGMGSVCHIPHMLQGLKLQKVILQ